MSLTPLQSVYHVGHRLSGATGNSPIKINLWPSGTAAPAAFSNLLFAESTKFFAESVTLDKVDEAEDSKAEIFSLSWTVEKRQGIGRLRTWLSLYLDYMRNVTVPTHLTDQLFQVVNFLGPGSRRHIDLTGFLLKRIQVDRRQEKRQNKKKNRPVYVYHTQSKLWKFRIWRGNHRAWVFPQTTICVSSKSIHDMIA